MSDELPTVEQATARVDEAIRDHVRGAWPDHDPIVVAFHVVVEVAFPGGRVLYEIADPTSSRHTAIGMLYAALNDPRWLDPKRLGRQEDDEGDDEP